MSIKAYERPAVRDYGDLSAMTAGILNNSPVSEDVGVKSNNVDIGLAK